MFESFTYASLTSFGNYLTEREHDLVVKVASGNIIITTRTKNLYGSRIRHGEIRSTETDSKNAKNRRTPCETKERNHTIVSQQAV